MATASPSPSLHPTRSKFRCADSLLRAFLVDKQLLQWLLALAKPRAKPRAGCALLISASRVPGRAATQVDAAPALALAPALAPVLAQAHELLQQETYLPALAQALVAQIAAALVLTLAVALAEVNLPARRLVHSDSSASTM